MEHMWGGEDNCCGGRLKAELLLLFLLFPKSLQRPVSAPSHQSPLASWFMDCQLSPTKSVGYHFSSWSHYNLWELIQACQWIWWLFSLNFTVSSAKMSLTNPGNHSFVSWFFLLTSYEYLQYVTVSNFLYLQRYNWLLVSIEYST